MSQTALTIGTEYTDRYMAGTGTENDPWIIGMYTDTSHDLQNLLDAVYTPNAYVKLVKHIEAAKDVTYREGISHAVTIAAAKLYADEKVQVSGLIVNASHCIRINGNYSHTIMRIQFLSMIYGGTEAAIYGVSNNTEYAAHFVECDFSLHKRAGTNHAFSFYAVHFDHCSIEYDASATTGSSSYTVFDTALSYEYCSIHYKGPVFGVGKNTRYLIKNAHRVGIVGEISTSVAQTLLFYNCTYCYFAGLVECTTQNTTIGSYSTGNISQCLTCVTETKGDYTVTPNTHATTIVVTADQLCDRDYLYSIGFLP